MAVTPPKIEVIFRQLAASLLERSERGYAILIIRDDTEGETYKLYNQLAEIEADAEAYTEANLQYLRDVYAVKTPYRTAVVRIAADGKMADATPIIEKNIATGWVTVAGGTADDMTALRSWIGSMSKANKTYKAVLHGLNAPDLMRAVNFTNETVTFADKRETCPGIEYLPTLAGILAACNVERGCTNLKCTNLTAAAPVDDEEKAVQDGQFILTNATDGVYVLLGINSMTTTNGSTQTEDMKYIETVEAMDLILDDIRTTWKTEYMGKYKNLLDNQMLLISAIKGYFRDLGTENILDPNYDNTAAVDTDAQRAAWLASDKSEAADWTDAKVREMSFKRDVYLAGDIKILGAMSNLTFNINMA